MFALLRSLYIVTDFLLDVFFFKQVVQKLGGYNRVTNQNQWKTIADKMGFHPVTTSITNLCKQAYKK